MKKTLPLFLFLLLNSFGTAQTLFDGDLNYDNGEGIKGTEWFGFYYDVPYPWIYHFDLGWVYALGDDTTSVWLYDGKKDWLWTNASIYPFLFSVREGAYLFFDVSSRENRQFFHYSVNRWLDDDETYVEPYDVDLYLRGTMNGWTTPPYDLFRYAEGLYVLVRNLEAGSYDFKVADANFANATDFGDAGAVPLGTPVTLSPSTGGGDMSITIPEPGTYTFTLDPLDPAAPILTANPDNPNGTSGLAHIYYLLGGFNGNIADGDSQMAYIGGGRFHAALTLRRGSQEMRIVGDRSFGGPGTNLAVGQRGTLVGDSEETFIVNFPKDGIYDVVFLPGINGGPALDVSFRTAVDLGPLGNEIFIHGTVNGRVSVLPMVRTGSVYEWFGRLAEGNHTVVFGDEGKSAASTYGLDAVVTPGVRVDLQNSLNAVTLQVGAGGESVYRIRLDGSDPARPKLDFAKAEDVILVHYRRKNEAETSAWGMHLFNVGGGDAIPAALETTWPVTAPFPFEDDWGRYAALPLIDAGDVLGIVVHRDGNKDIEVNLRPADQNGQVWLVEGIESVFSTENEASDATYRLIRSSARWLSRHAIAWDLPGAGSYTFKFLSHPTGDITFREGVVSLGAGGYEVALNRMSEGATKEATAAAFPFTSSWTYLDASTIADPGNRLKGHVVVAAYNASGTAVAATSLQRAGILDDLYAYAGELGVTWNGNTPTVRVWAPTALSVKMHVSAAPNDATALPGSPVTMAQAGGVWEATGTVDWKNAFYRFEVEVFVPSQQRVLRNVVTDPYAISLSTDSRWSQIIDTNDPAWKPAGWDALQKPYMAPEDIVVYELHMRDFSISDETVPQAQRGTFKAFAQPSSNGMEHLADLADAGMTHIHLLPMFDIASVNENSPYLREFWPNPTGYAPDAEDPQAIVRERAGEDGFNWGYDPYHFFAPEGSYATDSNGATRVFELREAVIALQERGLRVVQDVVFNHTSQVGQQEKSVLDKVVPGYYYRLTNDGFVHTDVCCPEVATENVMAEKLMVDALVHWVKTYKFDGFRFDLMGDHTLGNLMAARAALDELTLEEHGVDGTGVYLYGEGWSFGSLLAYRGNESANQGNLGGTGVGSFNDRIRNGLGHKAGNGFIDGDFGGIDAVRNGLAGNLSTGSWPNVNPAGTYTTDPQENVNYITAHDNYTLFDELQIRHGFAQATVGDLEVTLRRHRLALAVLAVGQGVPFYHAGVDLLRSKSGDRNSYDSGDWFNRLDFTYTENNFAVGLPPASDGDNLNNWPHWKSIFPNTALRPTPSHIEMTTQYFQELLRIRQSSPLFRLRTGAQIRQQVRFLNAETVRTPGLIVYSITDAGDGADDLDPNAEWVVSLINGNFDPVTFTHPAFSGSGLLLHAENAQSVDPVTAGASMDPQGDAITVPGLTMLVYTAASLPALPDIGNSPTYQRAIYLRGSMNDFGNGGLTPADEFSYAGDDTYELNFNLAEGTYEFKVADANYTAGTNFGGSPGAILEVGGGSVTLGDSFNVSLTVEEAGNYLFTLDAANPNAPTVTVTAALRPTYDIDIFLRGEMNNWGNDGLTVADQFVYVAENTYQLDFELGAQRYEFKVADANWSAGTNFGGGFTFALDAVRALVEGSNDNHDFTPPSAGIYRFTLETSDPASPRLTITRL